jgi:hypothetical protein
MRNDTNENIARSIWDGKASMGTDGSKATYSFVLSMSNTNVNTNVKGGFLPPTPQYMDPYSKHTEAAALAGLRWMQLLLAQYPNPTNSNPSPLLIPIDNDSLVKDVHRRIDGHSPTFPQLRPDYNIMQAIRTTIVELPIPVDIFHVRAHQDRDKHWSELDPCAQINVLADRQANAIHQKHPDQTGLFPTWVLGTRAALFHGDRQVTHDIPS